MPSATGVGRLMIYFLVGCWAILVFASSGWASDAALQIKYQDQRLTLSADNADLKKVLSAIAEKADIFIRFPASLNRRVTCNQYQVSLKESLQSLLRGLNHAIIYDKRSNTPSKISEVFVYPEASQSPADRSANQMYTRRIRIYERQIESLRNRLAKVDSSSARGKNYQRRIDQIEQKINKLEGQMR